MFALYLCILLCLCVSRKKIKCGPKKGYDDLANHLRGHRAPRVKECNYTDLIKGENKKREEFGEISCT
jgi:hypothetical protein